MWKRSILALVLAIPFAVQLAAQETQPRTPPTREPQQPQTAGKQLDRPIVEFFASKLILCNNGEIQAAQMAKEKASNAEIKQFADMLIKDHTAANEKLRTFAASYGTAAVSGGAESRVADAAKPAADQPKQDLARRDDPANPQDRAANPQDKPADRAVTETSGRTTDSATLQRVYEVCKDAHDAHMAKCKEMMSKLSGAEFDKAWLAGQVSAHVAFASELKALEGRSSDQFQSVVREMRTTVENHLQKAEALCKQLEGTKPTSTEGQSEKPANIKQ